MAYTRADADWQNGDAVTPDAMDNIEQGIVDAHALAAAAQATATSAGTAAAAAGTAAAAAQAKADSHTHTLSQITDFEAKDFAASANTPRFIRYDTATSSYPLRSTATNDPTQLVIWVGGPGPTKSGTGATGAVVGDWYVK